MTIQNIRLKIASPALKLKAAFRLPATLTGTSFIVVTRDGIAYNVKADYTILNGDPLNDPTQTLVAIFDAVAGTYKALPLSTLLAEASQIDQHITGAGPVNVLANAGIVRVDQAVGAPMVLNMPLASAKSCPVLISDWKGDAGTNNITINVTGADKLPGNRTTWTIAADTGSVFLRPIPGVGYAL